LFGIVGVLVAIDIIFLIPPTALSSARLRRELKEIEGNNVSIHKVINGVMNLSAICHICRLMIYLQ